MMQFDQNIHNKNSPLLNLKHFFHISLDTNQKNVRVEFK